MNPKRGAFAFLTSEFQGHSEDSSDIDFLENDFKTTSSRMDEKKNEVAYVINAANLKGSKS